MRRLVKKTNLGRREGKKKDVRLKGDRGKENMVAREDNSENPQIRGGGKMGVKNPSLSKMRKGIKGKFGKKGRALRTSET